MSWTTPPQMSEEDKLLEQLKELPLRDHTVVVISMTLIQAFEDASKIEPSFFKDLSFAACRMLKHATALDTLQFLAKHLQAAPKETTLQDILLLLSIMSLSAKEAAEWAATDTQKLVALLPSEGER